MRETELQSRWRRDAPRAARRALAAEHAGLERAPSGRATLKVVILLACAVAIVDVLVAPRGLKAGNTITVNTLADGNPPDKKCSLREAIDNANNPGTDTTGGACALGTGNDTIVCSVSGEIDLGSTLPTITNTLTIDGTGQGITINAGGNSQVFVINAGTVTLNTLTIEGGSGNPDGGAISNSGTLSVENSTLADNFSFSITNGGGAIYNNNGTLTVVGDTFFENVAWDGNCGAIDNVSGVVSVSNSTFYKNFASNSGGAIFNGSNQLLVIGNSTFDSNPGTLFNNGPGGVLKVFGSILADGKNDCEELGLPVTDLGHNIADDTSCEFSGTGANGQTIGDSVMAFLGTPSLENNGGPTRTLALQTGSPAIDAIPIGMCPATDQRGFPRPDHDSDDSTGVLACDIGAFEFGAVAPTPTPTPSRTPTRTPTKTGTRTPTRTPSRTPIRTPTHTTTRTPAPSRTPTRTPSRTPTRTPQRTPTRTPPRTATRTPSRTPTRTPSRTPTRTPSRTATRTPSRTPTSTRTP
jgi:CSLREA domain-containing protein